MVEKPVLHFDLPRHLQNTNILKHSDWTSVADVAEELAEHEDLEGVKVMLAVPWKRVIGNTESGPMFLKDVGIYPICDVVVREIPNGDKVLVFVGSEDMPEIPEVVGPRPERLQALEDKEFRDQMQ